PRGGGQRLGATTPAGPARAPPPATIPDRVTAASRSGDRRPRRGRGHDLVLGRAELLLVLGDRGGGERVADHVGGAAPHVEELVDAETQEHPRLPNPQLLTPRSTPHP